jgi:hypothetical protein
VHGTKFCSTSDSWFYQIEETASDGTRLDVLSQDGKWIPENNIKIDYKRGPRWRNKQPKKQVPNRVGYAICPVSTPADGVIEHEVRSRMSSSRGTSC